MKYFKYVLIVVATFIGLLSTTTKTTKPSEGIYPGDLFPSIDSLETTDGTKINLADLKGKKILVSFWASYDAQSRRDNLIKANYISQVDYPVRMVSVSFDKSHAVFGKILQIDKITNTDFYWANAKLQNQLMKFYRLEKGFKSYLIDENGQILTINPDVEKLNQYLN